MLHPSFTIVAEQLKTIGTENEDEEMVEILCGYQRLDGIMRECSFVFPINKNFRKSYYMVSTNGAETWLWTHYRATEWKWQRA